MSEVQLESLKIKIGKKELTLSIDEAKQLKDQLDNLFGSPVIWSYPSYPTYPQITFYSESNPIPMTFYLS